jgi:Skp family chaperone for outer membrane proteins
MKKLSILLLLIISFFNYSCKPEELKFAIVCGQVIIIHSPTYSVKQKTVNHYTKYTADEMSKMLTGTYTINEMTKSIITQCKPFGQ